MTTKVVTTRLDTQPIVEIQSTTVSKPERRCKVHGCTADDSSSGHSVETHSTIDHMCTNCGGMAHGRLECGSSMLMNDLLPKHYQHFLRIAERIFEKQRSGKIYVEIYAGQGCHMYAKRNYIGGAISLCFLHADCCGQNEGTISDIPRVYSFINEYFEIKQLEH